MHMKITNFSTLVVTENADNLVDVFKEFGFSQTHKKDGIDDGRVTSNILEDEDGHMISIASAPVPNDITALRMNVDNFDEAYDILKNKGFNQASEPEDTGTSKTVLMVSKKGFSINLVHHYNK